MLLAGRALVFSFGYRPRSTGSHKIIVDFSAKILGKEFSKLVFKFNKMRKIRHYLIYGTGFSISNTDTKNAINTQVIDGELQISLIDGNIKIIHPINCYVSIKDLDTIKVSSSATVKCESLKTENLYIEMASSSNGSITVDVIKLV